MLLFLFVSLRTCRHGASYVSRNDASLFTTAPNLNAGAHKRNFTTCLYDADSMRSHRRHSAANAKVCIHRHVYREEFVKRVCFSLTPVACYRPATSQSISLTESLKSLTTILAFHRYATTGTVRAFQRLVNRSSELATVDFVYPQTNRARSPIPPHISAEYRTILATAPASSPSASRFVVHRRNSPRTDPIRSCLYIDSQLARLISLETFMNEVDTFTDTNRESESPFSGLRATSTSSSPKNWSIRWSTFQVA